MPATVAAPATATAEPSAEDLIVGDWEYSPSSTLVLQYRFLSDGTFTQALQTVMGWVYCPGTYRISGDAWTGIQLSLDFGYALSTAPRPPNRAGLGHPSVQRIGSVYSDFIRWHHRAKLGLARTGGYPEA
ncbi:MAG: hypothetical protein U0670_13220 [Anaerolineae bacterium]